FVSFFLHLGLTLFPYTTLFRSYPMSMKSGNTISEFCHTPRHDGAPPKSSLWKRAADMYTELYQEVGTVQRYCAPTCMLMTSVLRSEEHTSELQSRFDLVCRLLL